MSPHGRTYSLPGPSALSAFRAARLTKRLQTADPAVVSLSARYVHFVHATGEFADDEQARLRALLDYGEPASAREAGLEVLVVPRLGTISPWASKATDIAHNTGLATIRRIERGTLYTVELKKRLGARRLAAEEQTRIESALHDRMTESVIDPAADPARLFEDLAGKPLQTVAVLAHGRSALSRPIAAWALRFPTTRSTTWSRLSRSLDAIRPTSS